MLACWRLPGAAGQFGGGNPGGGEGRGRASAGGAAAGNRRRPEGLGRRGKGAGPLEAWKSGGEQRIGARS
jgi:hypothetical protein